MDNLKEWSLTPSAYSLYVTVGLLGLISFLGGIKFWFIMSNLICALGVGISVVYWIRDNVSALDRMEQRIGKATLTKQQIDKILEVSQSAKEVTITNEFVEAELNHQINLIVTGLSVRVAEAYETQLTKAVGQIQSKGFTLMFNNMPYSSEFGKFDAAMKVAYFDACRSGDWTVVNRILRKINS